MQEVLNELMAETGVIRREFEGKLCGINQKSRGHYIVIPVNGVWYLHHDGKVKEGVISDSEKPAFWETKKEAQDFFDNWKAERKA